MQHAQDPGLRPQTGAPTDSMMMQMRPRLRLAACSRCSGGGTGAMPGQLQCRAPPRCCIMRLLESMGLSCTNRIRPEKSVSFCGL